jgi:hypothetical protein
VVVLFEYVCRGLPALGGQAYERADLQGDLFGSGWEEEAGFAWAGYSCGDG